MLAAVARCSAARAVPARAAGRARHRAAGAEPADASSASGEGQISILAVWPGYVERRRRPSPDVDWVTPFEDGDRLQGQRPDLRRPSDEAFALYDRPGEYDVGLGLGRRQPAPGRRRLSSQPVNIDLIPSYAEIFEGLKDKAYNTVDGVPYGVPHGRGANLLMWRTDEVKPDADSWERDLRPGGSRTPARSASTTRRSTSPTRPSYLMATKPELSIKNPYALDDTQFQAAVDLLKEQKPNDHASTGATTPSRSTRSPTATSSSGRPGRSSPTSCRATTKPCRSRSIKPEGGCDRLVRHLDDQLEDQEPELHVHVHRLHHLARGEQPDRRVLRRGAGQLEGVRADAEKQSPDHCDIFHADDEAYWENVWYWKTPRRSASTAGRT